MSDDATKSSKLYIPVAGTWARRDFRKNAWYRTASPFDQKMSSIGYTRVDQNRDPQEPDRGFWSGDVNGLIFQRLFRTSQRDWKLGGADLAEFIGIKRRQELKDADEVAIIAHSHGGQVVAFALKFLKDQGIDPPPKLRVVTVDMPVRTGRVLGFLWRRSMDHIYETASNCIAQRWDHLYSQRAWRHPKTYWRWLGSQLGPRKLKYARSNREIPGGHSGILSPSCFGPWPEIMANWSGNQRLKC